MGLLRSVVNGQLAEYISVEDRGFQSADGLFETMLSRFGTIDLWEKHYNRLKIGCEKLAIHCPEKQQLQNELSIFSDLGIVIIKLIVTRGSIGRGLNLPANMPENRVLLAYEYRPKQVQAPINLTISPLKLPHCVELAGIKHLSRSLYILATQKLLQNPEADEAILLDIKNNLIECITHNIFFVRNQTVITPDLTQAGVAGVMREKVIEICTERGIALEIRNIAANECQQMDECFITNAVIGLQLVNGIDKFRFSHILSRKIHGWLDG